MELGRGVFMLGATSELFKIRVIKSLHKDYTIIPRILLLDFTDFADNFVQCANGDTLQ